MSNDVTTPTQRGTAISVKNKIGLVLAGVLGLLDISGPFATPSPAPGEQGPPMVVLVAGSILGLISVIAVVYTWRTSNRVGARVVAGSRILSAITSLPAFFVGGVPAGLIALAAASVVVTFVAVGLVLSRPAEPAL
jgi:hypothetical protein